MSRVEERRASLFQSVKYDLFLRFLSNIREETKKWRKKIAKIQKNLKTNFLNEFLIQFKVFSIELFINF